MSPSTLYPVNGAAALSTCLFLLSTTTVFAIAVPGQGSWESTLQARDFDGNSATAEGYFDVALNITWLADASYSQTSEFDNDGRMPWVDANAWVSGLDFGPGIDNWRLPDVHPLDGLAYNYSFLYDGTADRGYNISAPGTLYAGSTASEMSHMYYNTLGNLGYYDSTGSSPQNGWGLINTGPFRNIGASANWTSLEHPPGPGSAWYFHFYYGAQHTVVKTYNAFVWAVHPGDVGTPIPPPPVFTTLGDVNRDDVLNAADVLLIIQAALGKQILAPDQFASADVAPLVAGVPVPDGQVNIADAYLVIRKILGLVIF